ncbi:MAG: type IV pilus modification PilV family protein [Solirubrobacterales bacterium]
MRAPANREDGFTIVEVLIAALILVAGAIATFGVLASATLDNQRAKATQVALDKAEQEMEVLRSLSDEELALTAAPSHSSEEENPSFRVSGGKYAIRRSPVSEYKEMVVNGGVRYPGETLEHGVVSPGPTSFTSGDVSGKVYRYIVWRNDTSCSSETCPGEQDYKQIIVAVKLNTKVGGGNPGGYVEVQSNFVNPEHSAADNPIPGAEGVVTGQQFFLSDTSCAAAGGTIRAEITADHALHNTLGSCASGSQTGTTKGAPDTLLTGPPPDPTPEDVSTPLTYDYSSNYENTPTPATAKGIQLRREESAGCTYKEGKTAPAWEEHRWVTDPMPKEFKMTTGEGTGEVTIDFFTRALSDSQYTGKLCIYLFTREESGTSFTDTMLANNQGGAAYWTWVPTTANKYWPREKWEVVTTTMSFNGPVIIKEKQRLGLALSLERAGTQGDAVSILYDHPNYRSRIEVATTTPLEGG